MTDIEKFRGELADFLERELPRQLGEPPPTTGDYWGGRRPDLPHPASKRYCDAMARPAGRGRSSGGGGSAWAAEGRSDERDYR